MKNKHHYLLRAILLISMISLMSAQSPEYRLQKIELIANSTGLLPTSQPIYKGTLTAASNRLLANPDTMLALINSASFSSISLDDSGQFYVSQGNTTLIDSMLRSIDSIKVKWIELRFNDIDSGLAFDQFFSMGLFRVPFTVWDLNGSISDPSDDIQLMPLVYSALDTTSTTWGIRNVAAPWAANSAKQSDWIYIWRLNTPFDFLWDDWTLQNDSSVINTSLGDSVLQTELLARITINSLNANPLTTADSISGLPRPVAGTTIRWTFGSTRMGLSVNSLVFNKEIGGANPNSQNISVAQITFNIGDSLHWTAVSNQPWISLNPDKGATEGIADEIMVDVSMDSLNTPITLMGSITISSPEDIAQTVAVIATLSDTIPPVISHAPVDSANEGSPLPINAIITDNWAVDTATVYYRSSGSITYESMLMVEGDSTQYAATIPGNIIVISGAQYYIEAIDSAMLRTTNPATNPETNPISLTVVDNEPPIIVHSDVATAPVNMPLQISAEITDNWGVESATLYYRSSGISTFQDTGMVEGLPDQYAATIPGDIVVASGVQYYIEAIDSALLRSTHPAIDPETNPISVAVVDNVPPLIVHAKVATSAVDVPLQVSAVITDRGGVSSSQLLYRSGGDTTFDSLEMATAGADSFKATISGDSIKAKGVQYYLRSTDNAGNSSTYPSNDPADQPISVSVTGLDFSTSTQPRVYRMMSVPYELDNFDPEAIFIDELGQYSTDVWRMFRRIDRDYVEYAPGNNWQIKPGTGFWLITRDQKDILFGTGQSSSLAGNYQIPLNAGWTIIGNPFNFNVDWDSVGRPQGVENQAMAWNGTGFSQEDVLVPGEGYFVYNQSDVETMLAVPAVASSLGKSLQNGVAGSKTVKTLIGREWQAQIIASNVNFLDAYNYIGVRELADLAWDVNDLTEVPPLANQLSLYFQNQNWGRYPGHYRVDFRPPTDSGHMWEVEIATQLGEIVVWTSDIDNFPDNWKLVLLDGELGLVHDLLNERIFRRNVWDSSSPIKLKVIAGNSTFTDSQILAFNKFPEQFHFAQNYPNPFNPSTTITFDLPKTTHVQIVIYDLKGREVIRLVDSQLEPGRHVMVWDGDDSKSMPVAAGIYFARLVSKEYSKSIKLVLLK